MAYQLVTTSYTLSRSPWHGRGESCLRPIWAITAPSGRSQGSPLQHPAIFMVKQYYLDRQIRKFSQAHPELKQRLAQVFLDLEADPFQPHLRLHPFRGELGGLYAISITHSYRIALMIQIEENEIVLLDIGSHDEVYG